MSLTQAELARELHISRATMSDNCKAGCPLTSVAEAKRWRACNVREKWNQRAHDASVRARPRQADVEEIADVDDEGEDEFEPQPKNLFDPCPELPMVTPADSVKKYICWALWNRGCPRYMAEWIGNHLVDLIKSGKGDEPEFPEEKRRRRRKSKAKPTREKVPAKG